MGVPHVAAALGALLMFGQSGLLARLTFASGLTAGPSDFPALVYDPAGASLVIAFAWKEFPYLALTAMAVLLTDSRELEEVARTLGASERQAFWRVTWPQLWRGTAPAVLAAFAFLIGQYEMPALLAPSDPIPLPLLIYERAVDPNLAHRGEAHVLALLAFSICLALVAAHAMWWARLFRHEAR
jgi:putative spermidine/putrescine transport system permease protein